MKISVICFSLTGCETGERLTEALRRKGHDILFAKKSKYLLDSIGESIGNWTKKQFQSADGIIFIGACGIAVRSIAPYVKSKKTDPAVLVIDECGQYVISLLSGHLGGANELADEAAAVLGARPVVTTATDLHRRFAVDVFAKKNGCAIFHMKAAKEASAALLAGKTVGFYSPFSFEGELPEGLILCDEKGNPVKEEDGGSAPQRPEIGVAVTVCREQLPFASTVQVVPRIVSMGMGCRKGKDSAGIFSAAEKRLDSAGIYREAVCCLASISLKKDEEGLLALSKAWDVPFVTFSEDELLRVPGEFTPSSFVKQITGVENVCERSAVLAAGKGRLIQKKKGGDGVTTALAVRDWRIRFE